LTSEGFVVLSSIFFLFLVADKDYPKTKKRRMRLLLPIAVLTFATAVLTQSPTPVPHSYNYNVCANTGSTATWTMAITFASRTFCDEFTSLMEVSNTKGNVWGYPACGSSVFCFSGEAQVNFNVNFQFLGFAGSGWGQNAGNAVRAIASVTWANVAANSATMPTLRIDNIWGQQSGCSCYPCGMYQNLLHLTQANVGTSGTCSVTSTPQPRQWSCGSGTVVGWSVFGDCGGFFPPGAVWVQSITITSHMISPTPVPIQL
jgi:hypothetical protein